jgi:DNA-binding transcriptional ArsR family regulator
MVQVLTPNAIAEKFDQSRQAVSKHIKILQECGLLKSKQVGREIYYQAELKKLKEIDKWLDPFRKTWDSRFDNLDKLLVNLKNNKA